jgi:hypothetical protein
MGTASTFFTDMIETIETVFWFEITYKTSTINAGIQVDVIVETQTGITQADVLLKLKKADFPSTPPQTGDSVTIATGTIGAGSYRIGQIVSEGRVTYDVIGTKIG